MAETSFAYYTGEVARRQSEFSGMAYYLGLEPGDCYKWTTASGRALYHRVNEIVRRADFTIDAKGEGFLSCAIETEGRGFDPDTTVDTSLSNSNLTATHTSAATNSGARVRLTHDTGKYYFEIKVVIHDIAEMIGLIAAASTYAALMAFVAVNGNMNVNGIYCGYIGSGFGVNDFAGVAVDFDAGLVWFRHNAGYWNGSGTANPATGSGGFSFPAGSALSPCVGFGTGSGGERYTGNFGNAAYAIPAPSGFSSWY
jgi:hypothetical protein